MTDSQVLRALPTCMGSTILWAAIADAFAHNTPWVYLGALIGFSLAIFILYKDFSNQNKNNKIAKETQSNKKDLTIADLKYVDTILRQNHPDPLLLRKAGNIIANLINEMEKQ